MTILGSAVPRRSYSPLHYRGITKACLLCVLGLVFFNGLFAQRLSRSPVNLYGRIFSKVLFADFNNDGHQDLLVVGGGFEPISVLYQNDGHGGFTVANPGLPGASEGVSLGDYDGDGLIDILMIGGHSSAFSTNTFLLRNKGAFVFEYISTGITDVDSGTGSFGDYDNDGDPDILVAGPQIFSGSQHDIYQNNSGSFSQIGLIGKARLVSFVADAWNDSDADGDLDYIVGDQGHSRLIISRNDGFDRFSDVTVDVTGITPSDIKWVNINDDGLPDIVVSGSAASGGAEFFRVLLNTGNNTFQRLNYAFEGFSNGDVLPIDIDSDGDTDLLVAGHRESGDQATLTLLYTNVNGTFQESQSGLPQYSYASLAAADVDHDNDLDVVITGTVSAGSNIYGETYLYINTGSERNTKPGPPTSPGALVDGQKVTINWNTGTDAQTPSGGLSYNVYLGSSPGNYNILKPLAGADGVKTDVTPNAGFNRFRIVENLAPGTYYYSVQTVDGGQQVSALSAENQFTIVPQAPVLESFSPLTAEEGEMIYVTGKNFLQTSSVSINNVTASYKIISSSAIRITVPAVRHSGTIKITTPLGTVVSSDTFCEKPKAYPINGAPTPCFGDETYRVTTPIPGVSYHWSVDGGGSIVSQAGEEATIRFPRKGQFVVKVIPESCVMGNEASFIVNTRGAVADSILGPRNLSTENKARYAVPFATDLSYTWSIDGVELPPGPNKNLADTTWRNAGTYNVQIAVANTDCPGSISKSNALIDVTLNQFSFVKRISLDSYVSAPTFIADLDGDLDDDILEGGQIRENVNGTLVLRTPYTTDLVQVVEIIDIDNDNDIDILVLSRTIKVYENTGNLTFVEKWSSGDLEGTGFGSGILAIDYNNDGKTDLVSQSVVFINNGAGFDPPVELLPPSNSFTSARAIDMNLDGYQDVLRANGELAINGTETGEKFHRDYSFADKSVAYISDMNRDGKYDFVDRNDEAFIANMSNGNTFSETFRLNFRSNPNAKFQDLNRDGFVDLALYGIDPLDDKAHGLFFNPLTNNFEKAFELSASFTPFLFMDLDKDGIDEMFFLESFLSTNHFAIFKNNSIHTTAVVSPTGLLSSAGANKVDLSWDKVPGYTYNVVVGSTNGSADIVSPLADLPTGKGFVRSPGNAGINSFFKLSLPPGTYHWSVQAIHADGTRSRFSVWESFTVESQTAAPSALTLRLQTGGTLLSWTDNTPDETEFLIERRTGAAGTFASIASIASNSFEFLDATGAPGEEVYYRVSAIVSGNKYTSNIASTAYAIVSNISYRQSFETGISYPVWNVESSPVLPGDRSSRLIGWERTGFLAMDGRYQMQTRADGQALLTPAFDLRSFDYLTLKAKIDYAPTPTFSGLEIRVESSVDGGQSWQFISGLTAYRGTINPRYGIFMSRSFPNVDNVKFRIRNGVDLAFDDFRIVNAPAPVQGVTVSQTAQNEVSIHWNEAARATHYLITRNVGLSETHIDTVEAPLQGTYLDHNVTTPTTYGYRILSYNKDDDEYAFEYSAMQSITLADVPFSIQSIGPMIMQTNGHKEVALTVFSGATPIDQLTFSATSSNPLMQDLVSFENRGGIMFLIIDSDTYVGDTDIAIQVSYAAVFDAKAFNLKVTPVVAAPAGNNAQVVCYGAAISNLTAIGTAIKWYAKATSDVSLSLSTPLDHGAHYFASQTVGGVESQTRLDVVVSVGVPAPAAATTQDFCLGATVADLSASGTFVQWYGGEFGGFALQPSTLLQNNVQYYGTQTINGCESMSRTTVRVFGTAVPTGNPSQTFCAGATVADLVATGPGIKWYEAATGGSVLLTSTTLSTSKNYYASMMLNGCESQSRLQVFVTLIATPSPTGNSSQAYCAGSTVENLSATGNTIQWYSTSMGGSPLGSSTLLVDGAHYFASQTSSGCESQVRLDVAVAVGESLTPVGPSPQIFCNGGRISDLSVAGNSIQWYMVANGGSPLSPSASLMNATYFATQNINGCESKVRLEVVVNVGPGAPTGSAFQTLCTGATVANLSASGTSIKWYDVSSGGSELLGSAPLVPGTYYYATQTVNGCESQNRLAAYAYIMTVPAPTGNATQGYCAGSTILDLSAIGTSLKWYSAGTGGSPLSSAISLVDGAHYFATQTSGSCESQNRLDVVVSVGPSVTPTGSAAQNFCAGATIADLSATGNSIKWYDAANGGSPLSSSILLANGVHYFATQTLNGCESQVRLDVTASVGPAAPVGSTSQVFCPGATTASLSASGTAIKWYNVAAGGVPRSGTDPLANGTSYYASQTVSGCESYDRLVVLATVLNVNAPVALAFQSFCVQGKLSDLIVTGAGIKWYSTPTGGTVLPVTTDLINGASYFASQTVAGCESITRTRITASIIPKPGPPAGQTLQNFEQGKTIADLVVIGSNVKWYNSMADANAGSNPLPATTPLSNTTYFATQNPAGCPSAPLAVTVSVTVVTGLEPDNKNFQLYPNPTTNVLAVSHAEIIDKIVVISSSGQTVIVKEVNARHTELDVSSLSEGLYCVQVFVLGHIESRSILKL